MRGRTMGVPLLVGWVALGCVQPVGIEGRPCPCAEEQGFACCPRTGTCVPRARAGEVACAAGSDARPGSAPAADGPAAVDAAADLAVIDAPADLAPPFDAPVVPDTPLAPPDVAPERPLSPPEVQPEVPAACPAGAGSAGAVFFDQAHFMGRKQAATLKGLSFTWGDAAPIAGIARDTWSLLIRGQLLAESTGDYRFRLRADQGINLWLGGQARLMGGHLPIGAQPVELTVPLVGGRRYDFMVEYDHDRGPAHLDVSWQPPGQAQSPIPACAISAGGPFTASCPVADEPCRNSIGPDCLAYEGLGLEAQFFAGPDFTRQMVSEASSVITLDWVYLLSEHPQLVDTRSIRLVGKLWLPRPEPYSFYLLADPTADVTLNVDGREQRVVADGAGVIRELTLEVPPTGKNEVPLRIDYVMRVPPERSFISLQWRSDSMPKRSVELCFLYMPNEVIRR